MIKTAFLGKNYQDFCEANVKNFEAETQVAALQNTLAFLD